MIIKGLGSYKLIFPLVHHLPVGSDLTRSMSILQVQPMHDIVSPKFFSHPSLTGRKSVEYGEEGERESAVNLF